MLHGEWILNKTECFYGVVLTEESHYLFMITAQTCVVSVSVLFAG